MSPPFSIYFHAYNCDVFRLLSQKQRNGRTNEARLCSVGERRKLPYHSSKPNAQTRTQLPSGFACASGFDV